uniref:Uncharacterized protein n=1 Tax=viral metagenome TaxID=1070528 RepID=A0A6C0BTN9_9ZZZZ
MTSVLYYSNFCENSKEVIRVISTNNKQSDVHFVCVDKRIKNGDDIIIMLNDNKTTMKLPRTITMVPSLLLLNDSHKVLVGSSIIDHINPGNRGNNNHIYSPPNETSNVDPECFDTTGKWCGIVSDTYSFWDQSDAELSTDGDGGMRQSRYYAGLSDEYRISTPEDTYNPDKINDNDIDNAKRLREDGYK